MCSDECVIKITIRICNPNFRCRLRILVHKLADYFGFGLPALVNRFIGKGCLHQLREKLQSIHKGYYQIYTIYCAHHIRKLNKLKVKVAPNELKKNN